jgi:uncharacterized protein (TIGR03067 family)
MRLDLGTLDRLALAQLWQVTVTIAVVALLTRLLGRTRPHVAYGLWMLVVIKCLMPPVWSSPTGIFCWVQSRVPAAQPAEAPPHDRRLHSERDGRLAVTPGVAAAGALGRLDRRSGPGGNWADILRAVWLGGVILLAGAVTTARVIGVARLRRSGCPAGAELAATVTALARRLGLSRRVRVLVTKRPFGPAVFGLFRPTLVLPEPLLAALAPGEIEPILTHELVHIRRGDLAAGFIQVLAQVVWWFHPLIWWASRATTRQRERCCDEESIAGLGCPPGHYARGLLRVLELREPLRPLPAVPGVRRLDLTRERLEHIMAYDSEPRAHRRRGRWLLVAVMAVVLVPGASRVDDQPGGTPAVKTDLEKLQGNWALTQMEMDGMRMPGSYVAGARIVVEGETFTSLGMGAVYKGTMAIDSTKSPRTLDMTFTEGPERGNTSLAIYEVDGDTWKLCLGLTGKERPQAFSTAPGSGHVLETLERQAGAAGENAAGKPTGETREQKATASGKEAPDDKGDVARFAGEWSAVSLVLSGQALPADFLKGFKRVVQGNETTVLNGGQMILKATFTVDASKAPRTIDYTITQGPDKGKMQLGIYEFAGETVKVCLSAPGSDRPTEFASQPGDGRTFGVWKKAQ